MLIAARRLFRLIGPVCMTVTEPWGTLEVSIGRLHLTGVYRPNMRARGAVLAAADRGLGRLPGTSCLAVSDFNTCRSHVDEPGATDVTAHLMDGVEAIGFRDL